eukprot:5201990-Pyramimonas_sp.AAC.1
MALSPWKLKAKHRLRTTANRAECGPTGRDGTKGEGAWWEAGAPRARSRGSAAQRHQLPTRSHL